MRHQPTPHCFADYGLTPSIFVDMQMMSSGSAVAGFPCSKASTESHKKGFFHKVEAFLYLKNFFKSTDSWN